MQSVSCRDLRTISIVSKKKKMSLARTTKKKLSSREDRNGIGAQPRIPFSSPSNSAALSFFDDILCSSFAPSTLRDASRSQIAGKARVYWRTTTLRSEMLVDLIFLHHYTSRLLFTPTRIDLFLSGLPWSTIPDASLTIKSLMGCTAVGSADDDAATSIGEAAKQDCGGSG